MEVTFEPVEVVRHEVPTAYRARIETKLAKLTKRLAKMGVPAPTVEFGPVVLVEFNEGPDWPHPPRTFPAFETVTVNGFEAKAEGWTGVAVLDWTVNPDEAFVARFPGHDDESAPEVSEELRTRGAVCDHCATKRRRNNTIVFTHDDGRMIGVGSGCVLEYLGVDPRTILMLSDFVKSIRDDDDLEVKPAMDPAEFVALAAEITRFFGFRRSAEADSTKELTTKIGIVGLTTSKSDRDLAAELADAIDMERGRAKAAAIAEWLAADDSSSDFIRSAKIAINGNPVEAGARHAGILAALPFSHDRHIGVVAEREAKRKAEAEARKSGVFVGSVGDKITVKGSVVFYNTYEGNYGSWVRLTIVTEDGNRVTTKGSGSTLYGWEAGDNVMIVGKVAEHDDDEKFGKSTVLERAKVTELDEHGDPLPECATARCSRPGIACDTCGKLACPNGHGRHWGDDDFHCEPCLEAIWESERERERIARATIVASSAMLGGRTGGLTYSTIRGDALDKLVPA